MRDFYQDRKTGGRRSSKRFGGRDSGGSFMHKAICDECGKKCEVPFKPRGDRPVFCSECFEGQGNTRRSSHARDFRKSDFGRSDFAEKRMYEAICDECGEVCELPFRPRGDKPVFCSECFGKHDGNNNKSSGNKQSQEQFDILNGKLDKILRVLSSVLKKEVTETKKDDEKKEVTEDKGDNKKKEKTKKTDKKKATKTKSKLKETKAKKTVTKKVATKKKKTKKTTIKKKK